MLNQIIDFLEVDSAVIVEETQSGITVQVEDTFLGTEVFTATKGFSEHLQQAYLDFGTIGIIHL